MYQRILLTNDGSPLSAAAIPYAAALARTQGADILVLRVSHAAGERPDAITRSTWRSATGPERDPAPVAVEAEPLLSEIASRLENIGVSHVGTLVLHGDPGPAIVEAAKRLEVDLVIMASHGLSGLKRAVLGSVADYVAHHAGDIPVLICHPLPPGVDTPLAHIEIPLDGSPYSETALPHAEAIVSGAASSVVLVRSIASVSDVLSASVPVEGGGMPVPILSVESAEEIVATQRAAVQQALAATAAPFAAAGRQVRIEIVEREPVSAILDVANRCECRLIVMSTHGRGGLGRALLGSVADEVVRNLEGGAVLLIHPREGERDSS